MTEREAWEYLLKQYQQDGACAFMCNKVHSLFYANKISREVMLRMESRIDTIRGLIFTTDPQRVEYYYAFFETNELGTLLRITIIQYILENMI